MIRRILLGNLTAYLLSQLADNILLSWLRRLYGIATLQRMAYELTGLSIG
ncbi:MAG: hypothetical protein Q9M35_08985 [Rhodothermus sp.]|nr:hypothetical protein [Rhodothermus sp.]